MGLAASVVITSFATIDLRTLKSVDRQSLPSSEFEVLLLGGDDDSRAAERLAQLVANRPNFRVVTSPDQAAGRYVLFLGDGVVLGDRALERLCAFADASSSDICFGKTSHRGARPAGADLFLTSRPRAEKDDLLLEAVQCPKLYRRTFLERSGLPLDVSAGPAADTALALAALATTDRLSVLADYPAFYVGSAPATGEAEAHLRAISHSSAPDEIRDRALVVAHRRYLGALIGPGSPPGLPRIADLGSYRSAVTALVKAEADESLSPNQRKVSRALRSDSGLDAVRDQVRAWLIPRRPVLRDGTATWADGSLAVTVELTSPASADAGGSLATDLEVRVGVYRPGDGTEWLAGDEEVHLAAEGDWVLRVSSTLRLDSLAGGQPLPRGTWRLVLVVSDADGSQRVRVPAPHGFAHSGWSGGSVVVCHEDAGHFVLDMGATRMSVVKRLDASRASIVETPRGSMLSAPAPQVRLPSGARVDGRLLIGELPVRATLAGDGTTTTLTAYLSGLPGSYPLATSFSPAPFAPSGATLEVDDDGTMAVREMEPGPSAAATRGRTGGTTGVERIARPAGRLRAAVKRAPGATALYRWLRR